MKQLGVVMLLAVAIVVTLGNSTVVSQKVWDVQPDTCFIFCEAYCEDVTDGKDPHDFMILRDTCEVFSPLMPGELSCNASSGLCDFKHFYCPSSGTGCASVRVVGIGTHTLHIVWRAKTRTHHFCEIGLKYLAYGIAKLMAELDLTVTGVPVGTTVPVDYVWSHESIIPTPSVFGIASAVGDVMTIDNDYVFFKGDTLFSHEGVNFRKYNQQGQFVCTAGDPIGFAVECSTYAMSTEPGLDVWSNAMGPCWKEWAFAMFYGEMYLYLEDPPYFPDPAMVFSLDIGSDTELSDHQSNGNEVFDPGDLYLWDLDGLNPLLSSADGIFDDAVFFTHDPNPDPPGVSIVAPTCSGDTVVKVRDEYFDLDGSDHLDFSLQTLTYGPGEPSIPMSWSGCVHTPLYLVMSFDDDEPAHYVGEPWPCEVPVEASAYNVYGSPGGQDEITRSIYSTLGAIGPYYLFDEEGLHPSLYPSPNTDATDNDDVDALDVQYDEWDCDHWYFSVDHEATYLDPATSNPLDPGAIYEGNPGGGFVKVIGTDTLGIDAGTDIDAFEFVWLYDNDASRDGLALIFSVDADDPMTPENESGGLYPDMIYASFLDGQFFTPVPQLMHNDIDALAAWKDPFIRLSVPVYQVDIGVGDVTVFYPHSVNLNSRFISLISNQGLTDVGAVILWYSIEDENGNVVLTEPAGPPWISRAAGQTDWWSYQYAPADVGKYRLTLFQYVPDLYPQNDTAYSALFEVCPEKEGYMAHHYNPSVYAWHVDDGEGPAVRFDPPTNIMPFDIDTIAIEVRGYGEMMVRVCAATDSTDVTPTDGDTLFEAIQNVSHPNLEYFAIDVSSEPDLQRLDGSFFVCIEMGSNNLYWSGSDPQFLPSHSFLYDNGAWDQVKYDYVMRCYLNWAPPGCAGGDRGDVDGNGTINVLDVLAVVRHILGTDPITDPDAFCRADCNLDGTINVVDALGIVGEILGTGTCGPASNMIEVTFDVMDFLKTLKPYLPEKDYKRFLALVRSVAMVPTEFALAQNYPNPFNPNTRINFQIPNPKSQSPVHTTLKVYNILGQEVRTLVDEVKEAGYYTVTWDGKDAHGADVASGVYFYRMTAGEFTATKRMVLMK